MRIFSIVSTTILLLYIHTEQQQTIFKSMKLKSSLWTVKRNVNTYVCLFRTCSNFNTIERDVKYVRNKVTVSLISMPWRCLTCCCFETHLFQKEIVSSKSYKNLYFTILYGLKYYELIWHILPMPEIRKGKKCDSHNIDCLSAKKQN